MAAFKLKITKGEFLRFRMGVFFQIYHLCFNIHISIQN